MRATISLQGIDRRPLSAKGQEGVSDRLHGLTMRDGLLTGIALTTEAAVAAVAPGTRVIGIHEGRQFHHLLLSVPTPRGDTYCWTDTTESGDGRLHPIDVGGRTVNSIAAVGDLLSLVGDDDICHAHWDNVGHDYLVTTPDDLAYDLLITQDDQDRTTAVQPIDSSLHNWLTAPEKPLQNRPTLAATLFGDSHAATGYSTQATLIRAAAESALDRLVAERGGNSFRHIVFGMAALCLYDGSHTLFSPVFALLPAQMSETVTADHAAGELLMTAWLHRHTVTATLRNDSRRMRHLVKGIDIYLSRPVTFQSPHTATAVTRDGEGRATSLSYPYIGLRDTEALFRSLTYTHALHIGIDELGTELLLQPPSADGLPLDLHTSGHLGYGATLAFPFQDQLHLGNVTTVLRHPHSVGISYRYPTLTAAQRRRETAEGRMGELLAGIRPDINDRPLGMRAQAVWEVTTESIQQRTAVYSSEVPYPLPGAFQVMSRHATALTLHLRLTSHDGTPHCYRRHCELGRATDRDSSDGAYAVTGGIHRSSRPAFHSLLLQEVHAVAYDNSTATYPWSYDLWEEESEDAYEEVLARSRPTWPLSHEESRLQWSVTGNPLVIGEGDHTHIGSRPLLAVTSGSRRTANGLIGEYPLYAFTEEGVWALRRSADGAWHAAQPVCHEAVRADCPAVADEWTAFVSDRGVDRIMGNRTERLSEAIGYIGADFLQAARLLYDSRFGLLLLINTERDANGHPLYPEAWVFNTDSGAWSTLTHGCRDIIQVGGEWWAVTDGETPLLARVRMEMPTTSDFDLLTRPFSFGKPLAWKRIREVRIHAGGCGDQAIAADSTFHLRLEGSHDACHWECIGMGTTVLSALCGSPYRWFRLHLSGHLSGRDAIGVVEIGYQ